ncbi:hypothetical protein GLW04_09690 [Halobacillus litoralis]|uniref:Uncharacterized protein n=1 Tax=Halobacillus litoralis TaxID=45668 RepID=A0A845E1J2_9BACI|nr:MULTISPECIES: hypothetical protein [Halobacillus]MCA1021011.1 hypothetical protein [Halobacillus litoralis]MYL20157.1 hypothetical protein [Halobacillus litoralis]MYL29252.1 hypothetical protein [Halobacillus halophilus]MYL36472.1 hypothetical protein [Halobacillus litoralis]
MEETSRSLTPLASIWLDEAPTTFTHAFVERLAYEWMIEIVNPFPIPIMEHKEYVLSISIEQIDGTFYDAIPIESYSIEMGEEFTVYRFHMYPPA